MAQRGISLSGPRAQPQTASRVDYLFWAPGRVFVSQVSPSGLSPIDLVYISVSKVILVENSCVFVLLFDLKNQSCWRRVLLGLSLAPSRRRAAI